jgi:hypothetical protein
MWISLPMDASHDPSRIADVAPGTEDRPEQAGRDRRRAWCSAPVARRSVLSQRRARSSRPGPGGRIASGFAAVRIHASSVCEIEGQAHAVPTACRVIAKPTFAWTVGGGRGRGSIADTGVGVRLLRSWSQDPICWHRLVSQARGMQRTRRQASLIRKVQAAMSRVDESRLRDAHTTRDHPGRDGNHDRATGGRQAPELRSAIAPRRRVT